MSSTLVIVESPTKAKKIQEILGDKYKVLASGGHILELLKGGPYGIGVDLDNFKLKYSLMKDKFNLMDTIISEAKKADSILLCTDADREGEAISWHLKERLLGIDKPIKRLTFNAITKKAIEKAMKQDAGDVDVSIVRSQEARRALDRIVGFMVSPYLSRIYGQGLSAGRVQSVATRMIIDRDIEISDFKPEKFWNITVDLLNKDGGLKLKLDKKITSQNDADDYKNKILTNNNFILSKVDAVQDKKYPPAPLTTSMLQQLASKTYGIGADKTMKAAQSLYENGYCTYIRTDSVRVEPDAIKDVRQWLSSSEYSKHLPSKENVHKNKDASHDAHEAIRPTDISLDPENNFAIIDDTEKKIYSLIWKYFVASQMNSAVYDSVKIIAEIPGVKGLKFKASGKKLSDEGYLAILGNNDTDDVLPNFNVGDLFTLKDNNSVFVDAKQTQPPPRYSESNLIKELENRGIGRPSTYASILSKICDKNYVEKKGNVYHSTELGRKIIGHLKQYFNFLDFDYTKIMEEKLDLIAHDKETYINMISQFYSSFKPQLDNAYKQSGFSLCDKCGSPMMNRVSKKDDSSFLGCASYPNCKNVKQHEVHADI
jgi:DNA topoisomerase-1